MSLAEKLAELSPNNSKEESDPFHKLDEEGIISYLFQFPDAFEAVADHITPQCFQSPEAMYVVEFMVRHWRRHGTAPTREIIKSASSKSLAVEDPYEEIDALIDRPCDPREAPVIRRELENWLRAKHIDRLYDDDEVIMARHRGEYHVLRNVLDDADAVGMEEDRPIKASDLKNHITKDVWVVENVVAKEQPMIIGGPAKAMKTSLCLDLAVSIASGRKFLGKYESTRQRVLFISGESGMTAINNTYCSIVAERNIQDNELYFDFTIPSLGDPRSLAWLRNRIRKHEIDVIIIDPLYLSMLRGSDGASATNLFDMGAIFAGVSSLCQAEHVTPIFLHHFNRKNAQYGIPTLDDLSFAGAAEFARQYILIRRAEAYHFDGHHKLNLALGGEGRSDILRVEVDEGKVNGRRWKIHVLPLGEIEKTKERNQKESQRGQQQEELDDLLSAIKTLSKDEQQPTANSLRTYRRWSGSKANRIIEDALRNGLITEVNGKVRGREVAVYEILEQE